MWLLWEVSMENQAMRTSGVKTLGMWNPTSSNIITVDFSPGNLFPLHPCYQLSLSMAPLRVKKQQEWISSLSCQLFSNFTKQYEGVVFCFAHIICYSIPTAAREGGPGQYSVSIFGISLGAGAWAAGNVEDLMISSEDLLWAAKAAASRWQSGELDYQIKLLCHSLYHCYVSFLHQVLLQLIKLALYTFLFPILLFSKR